MIPSRRIALAALIVLMAAVALPAGAATDAFTVMLSVNEGLRAQGMDYMLQQIDYLGREGGRASERYFQKEFRWVAGDPRRGSTGPGLDFLFDLSWQSEAGSGVPADALGLTLSRALGTWGREKCMRHVALTEVPYAGGDVTVFDAMVGAGGFGDPFAADTVVAGFPRGLEAVFGPDTLAFAVTFVFVGADGQPTDIDGDKHLDTALSEVYLNPAFDWTLAADGSGYDLETVLLHEVGHALGLGHFGPPPEAVMGPAYRGVVRRLEAIDRAAICLVHGRN